MLECSYSYDVIIKIYKYIYGVYKVLRIDLIRIITLEDRGWLREKKYFSKLTKIKNYKYLINK